MNGWRVAQFLIVLLFAAPFIYINWWGVKMSAWTAQVQSANELSVSGDTPMIAMPEIPDMPFSWLRRGIDRQRTTSQTFLNGDRVVIVSEYLGIEDVLKPGETAPDPAFDELYVTARAPAYMIERCDEVLDTLATRCGLIKTKVETQKNGEFRVTARLAYIPAYEIGPTDELGAEFVHTRLEGERAYGVNLPAQTADNRIAALDRSRRGCDALRETYKSCVVAFVRFDHIRLKGSEIENAAPGTDPDRMRVTTQLEVFTLGTRAAKKDLDALIVDIEAKLD